jgi:hypothetical protein
MSSPSARLGLVPSRMSLVERAKSGRWSDIDIDPANPTLRLVDEAKEMAGRAVEDGGIAPPSCVLFIRPDTHVGFLPLVRGDGPGRELSRALRECGAQAAVHTGLSVAGWGSTQDDRLPEHFGNATVVIEAMDAASNELAVSAQMTASSMSTMVAAFQCSGLGRCCLVPGTGVVADCLRRAMRLRCGGRHS